MDASVLYLIDRDSKRVQKHMEVVMRRWISLLLAAVMLFGFTACSGAPDVSDDGSDTTTTPTLSLAEAYTDALA